METFRTEEEQVEAIKRWWQENGKSTVLGVAIAMAAVFGWRGWNDYQRERMPSNRFQPAESMPDPCTR